MRASERVAASITTPRFTFQPTPLAGVWLVRRNPIADYRGFFTRFYCRHEFAAIGTDAPLAQINHSLSRQRGTVRGLHFQHPPHAEGKVVTCIVGRVFDVAIDLRQGSPTFLQWFGMDLAEDGQLSLAIPPGVAHGYQTLSEGAQILYLATASYSAEAEDGVNPFDPAVGIKWPETISEVSPRDAQRGMLNLETYRGIAGCVPDTAHG